MSILIFTVVVIGICIAVESGSSEQTEDNDVDNNSTTVIEEDGEINYGEEAEIADGLILRVNEVTETDKISAVNGLMAYKPDGGKYAIVNVTISNVSKNS